MEIRAGDTVSAHPRIAYDARLSLGQYRGMGRYLRALIAGREQQLFGLCARGESDPSLRLVSDGMHAYPLWEQCSLPRLVRRHAFDVFLAPYNTAPLRLPRRTRLVLIVHDLIFMQPMPLSRSLYQNAGRLYRRFVTPRAIGRADLILTVSKYTANQVQERFAVDPARMRVLPNSLGEEWFASTDEPRARPPFVLAVAGEAPSKNLTRAFQAFALCRKKMPEPQLRMKIAGVKPAFHAVFAGQAATLGIGSAVDFLPYVSDTEMRDLYRQAEVLFMPSLAEGFGIPVLEAMATGTPVAASSAASLPEVGGDAALYFDPLSIEQMAETLHRILSDAPLRTAMSDRGRIQARHFHPDVVRAKINSLWSEIEQFVEPAHVLELASC